MMESQKYNYKQVFEKLFEENDFVGILTKKFYYDYGMYGKILGKLHLNLLDDSYKEYCNMDKHINILQYCTIDSDISLYNDGIDYHELTLFEIINEHDPDIKTLIREKNEWGDENSSVNSFSYYMDIMFIFINKEEYAKALLTAKNCEVLKTWSKNSNA